MELFVGFHPEIRNNMNESILYSSKVVSYSCQLVSQVSKSYTITTNFTIHRVILATKSPKLCSS